MLVWRKGYFLFFFLDWVGLVFYSPSIFECLELFGNDIVVDYPVYASDLLFF